MMIMFSDKAGILNYLHKIEFGCIWVVVQIMNCQVVRLNNLSDDVVKSIMLKGVKTATKTTFFFNIRDGDAAETILG